MEAQFYPATGQFIRVGAIAEVKYLHIRRTLMTDIIRSYSRYFTLYRLRPLESRRFPVP
jgi:hypothetical protein